MPAIVTSAGRFLQRPGAEEFAGVVLLLVPAGAAPEAFVDAGPREHADLASVVREAAAAPGWHVHLVHLLVHPIDSRPGAFARAAAAAVAGLPAPEGAGAAVAAERLQAAFGPDADVFMGPAPSLPGDGLVTSRVQLWLPTAPGVAHLDLRVGRHGLAAPHWPTWPAARLEALDFSGTPLSDAGRDRQVARAARIAQRQAALAMRLADFVAVGESPGGSLAPALSGGDGLGDAPTLGGPPPTVAELREAADAGDARSQFLLGRAHDWGRGASVDAAEALRWYERAAALGLADAQFALGVLHQLGRGAPADAAVAASWYARAAEQGHARAQHNLARLYARGEGVPKDPGEAVRWLRLASSRHNPGAAYALGLAYVHGEGVPQDPGQALAWIVEAARHGDADAQNDLGERHRDGRGVAADPEAARAWFGRAAQQGHPAARANLRALAAERRP